MIAISAADLVYAGGLLNADFSDEERARALLHMDTVDVWACPGSGKTTLLVAKLAILGRLWRNPGAGVCVLSHTNVAKREIERKLARTPSSSVLNRPHYVGTIQSFVHTFLSYPAAEFKFGMRPTLVDDDATTGALHAELERLEYSSARTWLSKRANGLVIEASLRFSAPDLEVTSSARNFVGPHTETYKQLSTAKKSLAQRGWYCYSDMFALADWYLTQFPEISEYLALRFPYVFIDEMQDTTSEQWRVLKKVFNGRSVIQRFGDNKQAIFEDLDATQDTEFPSDPKFTIRHSHRFSRSIARLAALFSVDAVELGGNPNRADLEHGIIIFSPATILDVLPYFAAEVKRQLGDFAEFATIKAIGATGQSGSTRIPAHIGHYWPPYRPSRRIALSHPSCIADYIQDAVLLVQETGHFDQLLATLQVGVRAALRLQKVDAVSTRGSNLLTSLRTADAEVFHEFSRFVMELPAIDPTQPLPPKLRTGVLTRVVKLLSQREVTPDAKKFLSQELDPHRLGDYTSGSHQNVYDTSLGFPIELATIHSVKGETHDATLLLETQSYSPDLSSVIDYLVGEPIPKPGKRVQSHLKRLYVGASRPRSLLFLAMPQEAVGAKYRPKLEEIGWKLHDLG